MIGAQELSLYDYQHKNIDALRDGFKQNRRQLFYAACAFGKTESSIYLMVLAANKGKKVVFLCDRRILVMQTSRRMSKYGVEHGVIMAGMDRDASKNIQVASMQTIEAMGSFPDADLFIYDEAHCLRGKIIKYIVDNDIRLLGLTGSPFTKGLGDVYSKVTGLTAMKHLVEDYKKLVPLRVFVCNEIDMTGAKKIANEWSDKEVTERGIKITGDVILEWHKKTIEIYGEARKTIVFCASTAHGKNLAESFKASGFNFIAISYHDTEEYKADVLAEFSKSDSKIKGLISVEILVKGFDQSDVHIIVDARPLSKSFSSHVQKLGRGMRSHPGKEFCTLLDHAGNYLRFKDQWDSLYSDGVIDLDDGAEKTKQEPSKNEKESAKCPSCGALWVSQSDICSHCGNVLTKRVFNNEVSVVSGEMSEVTVGAAKEKYTPHDKARWYAELLGYCNRHGRPESFALFIFRKKFSEWPSNKHSIKAAEPGTEILNYMRSRNIAYARSKKN